MYGQRGAWKPLGSRESRGGRTVTGGSVWGTTRKGRTTGPDNGEGMVPPPGVTLRGLRCIWSWKADHV